MNYQLHEIVNQEETNYKLLQKEGINNTEELLHQAGKIAPRKKLMEKTGIEEEVLLAFIYSADLLRIKGIGKQYVNLLCQADICTIEDLANWNGEALYKHLEQVNAEHQLVHYLPSVDQIHDFIEQAQQLPTAVEEELEFDGSLTNWVSSNQKGLTAVVMGALGLLLLGVCYLVFKRLETKKVFQGLFNMTKGIGQTAFLGWIVQETLGTKNSLQKNVPAWLDKKKITKKLEDLQNGVRNTINK